MNKPDNNIESNKALVAKFLKLASSANPEEAFTLMSPDAKWWVPGKTSTVEETKAMLIRVQPYLKAPVAVEIGVMTAEDDRVAVEARSFAERTNGKIYRNQYHFLFTIRNGKIVEAHEHNDTQHAQEIMGDLI